VEEFVRENLEKQEKVIQESMSKFEASISKQSADNDQIKKSILQTKSPENKSYAEVLKRKSDGPVVVIKPKNAGQNSEATEKHIKEKIDPTVIPINILRSVSRGSIVVQCQDKDKIEECKQHIEEKLGENYSVTVPETKSPVIKIVGLTEFTDESVLKNRIVSQNSFIANDAKIEVVEYKEKNGKIYASVKCDGNTFGKMIEKGRIVVGWDSCRVYEHFRIARCFKCSGFRHIAKDCRHELACPKCAGPHELKNCKSTEQKCINCMTANKNLGLKLNVSHFAWHRECEVFKRKINSEMKKTEYVN
jgi:hypothetical protein